MTSLQPAPRQRGRTFTPNSPVMPQELQSQWHEDTRTFLCIILPLSWASLGELRVMLMMSPGEFSFWRHPQKPVKRQIWRKEMVFTMFLCTTQQMAKALGMW